jgi:hypothetical protein
MATTTNYSWVTPDDTSLVKDGASAIRTLGSSVDSTVFANANAAIPKTIVDAKGDLIAATAADTVARLAVGTNDQVLVADSTAATGLKWATAASGGWTSIATGTLSSTSVVISSIPQTYKELVLTLDNPQTSGTNGTLCFRINAKTTNYYSTAMYFNQTAITNNANQDRFLTGISMTSAGGLSTNATIYFPNYIGANGAGSPAMYGTTMSDSTGNFTTYFPYQTFAAITSITLLGNSGQTMSGGTYTLYGVK